MTFVKYSNNIISDKSDFDQVTEAIATEKTQVAKQAAWGEVPLSCAHLRGRANDYSGWYRRKVTDFGERIGARRMTVARAEALTGIRLPGHGSRHVWVV